MPDEHKYEEHYEFPGECVTCGRAYSDGHFAGRWVGVLSASVARSAAERSVRIRADHLRAATAHSDENRTP